MALPKSNAKPVYLAQDVPALMAENKCLRAENERLKRDGRSIHIDCPDLLCIVTEIMRMRDADREGYDTGNGNSSSMGLVASGPKLMASMVQAKLKGCLSFASSAADCGNRVRELAKGLRNGDVPVWHAPPDSSVISEHLADSPA